MAALKVKRGRAAATALYLISGILRDLIVPSLLYLCGLR